MSLRDNLSKLTPNEFLEKMQDMFQMYQESQEDYYEETVRPASAGTCLATGILTIKAIKDEDRKDLKSEETEKYMLDSGSLPRGVAQKLFEGIRLMLHGLRILEEKGNRSKGSLKNQLRDFI